MEKKPVSFKNTTVEPTLLKYLFQKSTMTKTPFLGTFELTPRCNLNCKMCYVRLTKEQQMARGNELTAEQWLSIAKDAAYKGMLMLLLTGGEPLLRPDFREIFLGIKKLGIMVSINSNGTLIDDDMIEFFRKNPPYRINITLYGSSRETYGRLCGNPDGFDKAVNALKKLKEAGVSVKTNCSITPYNRDDVADILRISRELGLYTMTSSYMFPPLRKSHDLIGCGDRLTAAQSAHAKIFSEKYRHGEEGFIERGRQILEGVTIQEDDSCFDVEEAQSAPTEPLRCRAGKCTFWITWDGRMLPCGMMETPSANLLELGFGEAWNRTVEETKKIMMPLKCTNCDKRANCEVCAAAVYAETGSYGKTAPAYLCERTNLIYKLTKEEVDKYDREHPKTEE